MNKRSIFFMIVLSITIAFAGCSAADNQPTTDGEKLIVAASIVPEAGFIEAVAGDLVDIVTIIPPGNSPANYQPTTKEMQALSDADIYFVMQVPTEEANILPKISDFNEDIKLINLRDITSETYPLRHAENHSHDEENHDDDTHDGEHDEDAETIDPHIWLSPKRVILMVQLIADELSMLDADNAQTYQKNAEAFVVELEALDKTITSAVDTMDNKAFMIYHGSYGYFADDYGLEMIAIEADGKAATAAKLQEVITYAKDEGVTAIFYQDEFDDTQAQTVAQEIGGSVMKSTPLSKDYISSLEHFVNTLTNNGE